MIPDKPVSEITANDIKTEADWEELCQRDYNEQQAKYETELAAAKEAAQVQIDKELALGKELKPEEIAERLNNVFVETQPETVEMIKAKFSFLKPMPMPDYVEPERTLDELKARKLSDLKYLFDQACEKATVEMDGVSYDANETANRNVAGLITSMEAGGVETVQFCAADNSFHELTLADLKALQLLIIGKGQELYATKWALRTQIEAAESVDALDAVRIEL